MEGSNWWSPHSILGEEHLRTFGRLDLDGKAALAMDKKRLEASLQEIGQQAGELLCLVSLSPQNRGFQRALCVLLNNL